MTLLEQALLVKNEEFVLRVRQAQVKAAIALMADPNTKGKLADYCTAVLNEPQRHAWTMAVGVATNAAVTAESTDNDIEWTVNSLMSAFAGKAATAAATT